MNFKNIFVDVIPREKVIVETAEHLLEPLRSYLPGAVNTVLKTLDDGRNPKAAGQSLADAIRVRGEQIRAEEREQQKKLEARLETQEKQLDQQAKDIRDVQKDLYEMDTQCVKLKQIIARHVETIQDQRNLLAKQYERLARLSGLPKDE